MSDSGRGNVHGDETLAQSTPANAIPVITATTSLARRQLRTTPMPSSTVDLTIAVNLITGAAPCEDDLLREQAAMVVYRELVRIARWHRSEMPPEELAQDAIVHILDCGALVKTPRSWLPVIVRNVWFSRLRASRTSPHAPAGAAPEPSGPGVDSGLASPAVDPDEAGVPEDQGEAARGPATVSPFADEPERVDFDEGWHVLCARLADVVDDGTMWSRFLVEHEAAIEWRPEQWTETSIRRAVALRHATTQEVADLLHRKTDADGAKVQEAQEAGEVVDLLHPEADVNASEIVEESVLERARATHARAESSHLDALSDRPVAFRRNALSELCARRGRTERGQVIPNALGQKTMLPALLLRHAVASELESLREMLASGTSDPDSVKRRIQNRFANRHRLTLGTVDRVARRLVADRDLPRPIRLGAVAAAAVLWNEHAAQLIQFRTYAMLLEAAEEAE